MQLLLGKLSTEEIETLLENTEKEIDINKKKLISIKLEKNIIERKIKVAKKEKKILEFIKKDKNQEDISEKFNYLSNDNSNDSLFIRYITTKFNSTIKSPNVLNFLEELPKSSQ